MQSFIVQPKRFAHDPDNCDFVQAFVRQKLVGSWLEHDSGGGGGGGNGGYLGGTCGGFGATPVPGGLLHLLLPKQEPST